MRLNTAVLKKRLMPAGNWKERLARLNDSMARRHARNWRDERHRGDQ